MAPAAYTQQPHKFNRFNRKGVFGRDKQATTCVEQSKQCAEQEYDSRDHTEELSHFSSGGQQCILLKS